MFPSARFLNVIPPEGKTTSFCQLCVRQREKILLEQGFFGTEDALSFHLPFLQLFRKVTCLKKICLTSADRSANREMWALARCHVSLKVSILRLCCSFQTLLAGDGP